MNKTIGILGYGWLGTSLGVSLLKEGYQVKGSTTSTDKLDSLSQMGLLAYPIHLKEGSVDGKIVEFLTDLDVLVINVPPNLRKDPSSDYVAKMQVLLENIKGFPIHHILFVSSTSVYGDVEGEITEDTVPQPVTKSGKQLLEAERLFLNETRFSTTIIRFGGLIGEDRHPITQLSGRTLTNGGELINLIHKNDCIHMIRTILKNGYWNQIFNGVYPYHPTKAEYYTVEAKKRGVPPPNYTQGAAKPNRKKVIFRNFYVKKHLLTTSISS